LAVENSVGNQCLKDIITETTLAEMLDLKIGTLRSYRKDELPHIKVGMKTYYSQKSVYIWLLKREKGG